MNISRAPLSSLKHRGSFMYRPVRSICKLDLPVNGNSWRNERYSFHGMSLAAQVLMPPRNGSLTRPPSIHLYPIFTPSSNLHPLFSWGIISLMARPRVARKQLISPRPPGEGLVSKSVFITLIPVVNVGKNLMIYRRATRHYTYLNISFINSCILGSLNYWFIYIYMYI